MEGSDLIQQTGGKVSDLLYEGALLSKSMFALICLLCLVLFFYSLYKQVQRRWQSTFFMALCASVFVWAILALLASFFNDEHTAQVLADLSLVGIIPIPPLLCLHTQKQVSFKEPRPLSVVLLFIIPAVLIFLQFSEVFFAQLIPRLPLFDNLEWYYLVFYLFSFAVLIRAYLLCFAVFFQMPPHMRRSTIYMLIGISAVAMLFTLNILWDDQIAAQIPAYRVLDILTPLAAPLAFVFLLYPLYSALRIMPSTDVIVTSREFVMGSLSTAILVLNHANKILDWNKSDWDSSFPLPEPRFRESYEGYRIRMLEKRICRISPHNENIVIAKKDEKETHFLLESHLVRNNKRSFGSIVEISDITPVYTMLHFFEQIARYDQLTGTFNRNAYLHRVTQIAQAHNMPLLILVGDINRLKYVNDTYGHLLGDQLLITITDIIKQAAPPEAFIARVGGDEFVILVPNSSAQVGEDFILNTAQLCSKIHHEVFGTPSISWGYAIMATADQSYNEVFSHADAMMYADKRAQQEFRSSGLIPEDSKTPSLIVP